MLTIRNARLEDAASITECACASFEHYSARLGKKPGPMLDDYTRFIAEDQVHVAVDDGGAIVGILVLQVTEEEGFYLTCVAVRPSSQGRGVGRKLLELAESEALSQGFCAISLYTNEAMVENHTFYLAFGYKESDRRVEQGYARVFYRKELAPVQARHS